MQDPERDTKLEAETHEGRARNHIRGIDRQQGQPRRGQLKPGHLYEYPGASEQVPETVVWGPRADLALQAPAPGIVQAPLGISQVEPGP